MKALFPLILIYGLITLTACDRPACSNANPIFDEYPPSAEVYKAALAKELGKREADQLSYWIQKHEKIEGQDYLYCNVQGDDLCAILVLSAADWKKLSSVVEAGAISYRGAELTNLKYQILAEGGKTQFVFMDYENIID
ncbi:MAG: hypothetical protein AAF927_19280 [Bacteroidota bacterium]